METSQLRAWRASGRTQTPRKRAFQGSVIYHQKEPAPGWPSLETVLACPLVTTELSLNGTSL